VAFPEDGVDERRNVSEYSNNVTLCMKYGEISVGLGPGGNVVVKAPRC
jgi:hypothetical protein